VETLVITWRELLIVVVLFLAVYIAEMLLLTRSRRNIGWRIWRKGVEVNAQSHEVEALRTELSQLREHVAKLQAEFDKMKSVAVNTPYSQAIQMAQQGLDANQVAASCGISRGEAELIVALYRANAS
jgi:hypothetical protein